LAAPNKSCYLRIAWKVRLRIAENYRTPLPSEPSECQMNRPQRFAIVMLACALALGSLCVGCNESPPHQASQSDARPPAEKSFDEIAQIVRSALETGVGGVQSGFVSEKANARSHFAVHNDVTSQLIPPAAPGENYRATITVTSHTIYSLRHIPDSDKKSDQDKKKTQGQNSGSNSTDDSQGANGVEAMDDSVTSSSKGSRPLPGLPEDAVARRADEEVRTYELAYENSQWVLKTELDLKTELSVKNAFDYALKLQP
jgi:hypothetical protein